MNQASNSHQKESVFPKNFLWGVATASHQVEGNTTNDWTEWEKNNASRLAKEAHTKYAPWQQEKFPEMFNPENYISGLAADHWNRYEEDFDILQSLNLNAYRFSIEWSRIEPREGEFDEAVLAHYREMILSLRRRGIEPFVTLWHWTNPLWIETQYHNWENPVVGEKFLRFVEKVVTEYQDLVCNWVIFNEPNTFVGEGYITTNHPPGRRSFWLAYKAIQNFKRTHKKTYTLIHTLQPQATVILSHWFSFMRPYKDKWWNRLILPTLYYFRNDQFFKGLTQYYDAIGVQFYRVEYMRIKGWGSWGPVESIPLGEWQNDLGWDLEPEALEGILGNLKKFNKPIYITESGLADATDASRPLFIQKTLQAVSAVLEKGVPVKGYFHWSLLDNFEWDKGFWPRFGLIAVDRTTFARTIRPSAHIYASLIQEHYKR